MSVGVGVDVEVGFSVETTQNTRVAPATFVRILQESLKCEQGFIRSAGLGGGRRIGRRKAKGNKLVGGSVSLEVGTAELEQLFQLITFSDPTPSGDDPYTRAYAGFGDTPISATWGFNRPHGAGMEYFEYEGSVVNQATITQNAGEFLTAQLELICYDETTDQTAPTFAPPSDEQLLTFQDVTTTVFGSAECFDGFSLNINHGLGRSAKACAADAGRGSARNGGGSVVTGTLNDDFKDMDHYNRYLAGTEGALVFAWAGANSSSITITMNVFFTGETPNVSGPGEVKQGIPFEVISATSDAAAITMTVVNGES
jgi:hypothetical protein